MSCLFEPIHGRFPTHSICDGYVNCEGCSYNDSKSVFFVDHADFSKIVRRAKNAQRIRCMADEELSDFLFDFACYIASLMPNASKDMKDRYSNKYPFTENNAVKRDLILEWLKAEEL